MNLRELIVAYGDARADVITNGEMVSMAAAVASQAEADRLLAQIDRYRLDDPEPFIGTSQLADVLAASLLPGARRGHAALLREHLAQHGYVIAKRETVAWRQPQEEVGDAV